MSEKFKKASTLIELVISVFIMATTALFAINILFKKSKVPKRIVSDKITEVVCYNGSNHTTNPAEAEYTSGYCDIDLAEFPELAVREFFEISLIGAGASGSDETLCGPGEQKIIIYPSLTMPFGHDGNTPVCNYKSCATCTDKGECLTCVKGYKLADPTNPDGSTCVRDFKYRAIIGNDSNKTTKLQVIYDNETKTEDIESAIGGTCSGVEKFAKEETSSEHESGNINKSGEVRIRALW